MAVGMAYKYAVVNGKRNVHRMVDYHVSLAECLQSMGSSAQVLGSGKVQVGQDSLTILRLSNYKDGWCRISAASLKRMLKTQEVQA